ncbi:hypothetical protein [Deinococcus soli (ex Cha et al. 2016)]|uniref:Uncharacterized protein n=2 Tax=Deinococcus soli (ex Cha et al. 2016) TaxID=1309411 RepID=A0ACC6KH35_9DEIO|nr:hypothetical protein [Deinococcus soli (ex Cha et al. 2016)]MDR6218920.1 hypothetical protein [Deinococcus soli (ex Cha et al. 2016)]MDR6328717.1 hypothetical protein [Deinococcus soli (ex Cha et al. 2016)]MDR6751796.1 hypothetical protein [Deinococcus soli (ex Cha et al. 2016)]
MRFLRALSDACLTLASVFTPPPITRPPSPRPTTFRDDHAAFARDRQAIRGDFEKVLGPHGTWRPPKPPRTP